MKRNDYLDVNELCIILNKTNDAVRYMLKRGKLKTAFKKGPHKKWYVSIEEIIEYLNKSLTNKVTRKTVKEKIAEKIDDNFPENTEFVTVKEAKKILNRSSESIYNKIKTGKLKAKKVRNGKKVPKKSFNGKYMISIDSIKKLKKEQSYWKI
jgi:predicted transport protein